MNDAIVGEEVADKREEVEQKQQFGNFEWTHCNECTHHRTHIKKV